MFSFMNSSIRHDRGLHRLNACDNSQRACRQACRTRLLRLACILVFGLPLCACREPQEQTDLSGRRLFRFEYSTTISGIAKDANQVRIWLPLPTDDGAQTVQRVEVNAPAKPEFGEEKVYGNRLAYLEFNAPLPDEIPISVTMDVDRHEVAALANLPGLPRRRRLLSGDRLAPLSDAARLRAARATHGHSDVEGKAKAIYDQVLADVDYDKSGVGWGRGNLEYVCESGKGNCSDFHTLFIAMSRAKEIPAVFEIGFPLPERRGEGSVGGYHCWAWYQDDAGRWRPVDASEADKDPTRKEYFFGAICENRVAFSRGRDLILDPPQSGGPVNFLIYPYVEVDGRTDAAKIESSFRFRDL